ncbi:DUF3887 domain-containing protein [Romboutsia lituseburensis]|uniref:DUF3887 domain-containing protein n=1 Tax=Romboutsia lituseburensis TaxID=1537 RepID=UPI00215A3C2C|nr:DUF3887 domain-containing protein [Romboutsia lituseburensis]MCR8745577.1 DUF3887 domain-containing protein [Romboutsia lituseburensis]
MKKLKVFLLAFLVGVILVGCSSSKISEDFDEAALKTDAQSIVQMFCNNEYESVVDKMSDKLKAKITAGQLKEVWEPIQNTIGKFDSVNKEGVVGNNDDNQEMATVVEIIKCEKGKAQFKITYNKDMKLEGLYIIN